MNISTGFRVVFVAFLLVYGKTLWAGCGGPTLNSNNLPYSQLDSVKNQWISISDEPELRASQMSAMVGAYRSTHGVTSMPTLSTFKIIYKDGTFECGIVNSAYSPFQAQPLPNTQREADSVGAEPSAIYVNGGKAPTDSVTTGFVGRCYDYYSDGRYTGTFCD